MDLPPNSVEISLESLFILIGVDVLLPVLQVTIKLVKIKQIVMFFSISYILSSPSLCCITVPLSQFFILAYSSSLSISFRL